MKKPTTIISGTKECKAAETDNITIIDGKVYINGRKRPIKRQQDNTPITIVITGNVGNLTICGADIVEVTEGVNEIEVHNAVNEIKLSESFEGDAPTLKCQEVRGDICGNVTIEGSVHIDGNVNNSTITTESSVAVKGDVSGAINANSVTARNVSGDINANSVTAQSVSGDITGTVYAHKLSATSISGLVVAGTGLDVKGDINGIVAAGTGINIEGNVYGSVFAGTSINISEDCTGTLYVRGIVPEGFKKDKDDIMEGAEILSTIIRRCPPLDFHDEGLSCDTVKMIETWKEKRRRWQDDQPR